MSHIFNSGSSSGLSPVVVRLHVEQSHCIGLHTRNEQRTETARHKTLTDLIALFSINSAHLPIGGSRYE
jgi:hypothetical protein